MLTRDKILRRMSLTRVPSTYITETNH